MTERANPSKLANLYDARAARGQLPQLVANFLTNFPQLVSMCNKLGLDIEDSIRAWARYAGESEVADWLDTAATGANVASRWQSSLGQKDHHPTLFQCLVEEYHLCSRISVVGPWLKSVDTSVERALHISRKRVANAAFYAALESGWQQRHVFARKLELAREYLQYLVDEAEFEGRSPLRIRAKLGISTITAARFVHPSLRNLERAIAELKAAHAGGYEGAAPYFLEACLQKYDLTGEVASLREATELAALDSAASSEDRLDVSAAWWLNTAEVWVKLAGEAETLLGRNGFLARAASALEACLEKPMHVHEEIRYSMLNAFTRFLVIRAQTGDDINSRGVQFPFGLRGRRLRQPGYFDLAGPDLLDSLVARADDGEYLYRDIAAELSSFLASRAVDTTTKVRYLRIAIGYRRGKPYQKPLNQDRAALDQALDELQLARFTADEALRAGALKTLCRLHTENPDDAASLTALAVEIDERGGHTGALLPVSQDLALAIRNSEVQFLYELAARRALKSRDTKRIDLGGRGGVHIVEDARGVTGQTFVFKVTTEEALHRDRTRSTELTQLISAEGMSDRFGVVEHVAQLREAPSGELVSVLRFARGSTVHDELLRFAPPAQAELLSRTAEFLALFHGFRPSGANAPTGVRRQLWCAEVGRWLRVLGVTEDERKGLFAAWWELVKDADELPRRDAHALNWLVDEDTATILAVDLESVGWRPFGYELAQLTEDGSPLQADDWATRLQALARYDSALKARGYARTVRADQAENWYAAGLAARALREISDPRRDGKRIDRGVEVLQQLVERYGDSDGVGKFAGEVMRLWNLAAGTIGRKRRVTEAGRRRISRAMSYHLRHNREAAINRQGWMHAEELAVALRAEGHKVSADQLLAIGGAIGEPRFEREGMEIRARYGHSNNASIDYRSDEPPGELFHATPLRNLKSIVEAQSGLVRGKRAWVHLTEDPHVALRAARRQVSPVALLRIDTSSVEGLVRAVSPTWLAPRVPLLAIEAVPLWNSGNVIGESTHGLSAL